MTTPQTNISSTPLLAIIEMIRQAEPNRDFADLSRRLMKMGKEYGEALQAYLALTGNNYKNIQPAALREELVDMSLLSLDMLFYPVPGEEHLSSEELVDSIRTIFETKIQKWMRVREHRPTAEPDITGVIDGCLLIPTTEDAAADKPATTVS